LLAMLRAFWHGETAFKVPTVLTLRLRLIGGKTDGIARNVRPGKTDGTAHHA